MSFLPNSAAANGVITDGAYAYPVAVPANLQPLPASNVIAIVGAARRGKVGVPIGPITVSATSGMGAVYAAIGDGVVNGAHISPYDMVRAVNSAQPEGTAFVFVRTTDGTETAATMALPDSTGFASQSFTVGGTWTTGKTLTMTLTPSGGTAVPITYVTGTNGDTSNAQAAAQILAIANQSTAVLGPNAFLQPFSLNGLVITATASQSGAGGNSITSTTNTPSTMTFVAGGATLSGGAAPGALVTLTFNDPGSENNGATGAWKLQSGTMGANPVFTFTLAIPYLGQQTWANIAGSASGGAYSATTLIANTVAAINGQKAGVIGSPSCTAAAGSSTNQPLLNVNFSASGGTDGVSGLATGSLLGVDGITGRAGMYALRGQAFGVLVLAGCTDPTADVSIQAFLDSVGGIAVTAFPSGTSTNAATLAKSMYALSNRRIYRVEDWCYGPDLLAGQQTALFSPAGKVAGIISSLNSEDDASNKPDGVAAGNIFGTERTVGPNNASGLPYTIPVDPLTEGAVRKLNGIGYITNGQPRANGLLGLAHGKMSDGISNLSDVRMYDYIAARVLQILQRYVGQNQTPPPTAGQFDNDKVRKAIRADFNALDTELTSGQEQQLADLGYQFTGTAQQVAVGYCPWDIQGTTLSGIEWAIAGIAVGTAVVAGANA